MRRNRTFDPGHWCAFAATVALHAALASAVWSAGQRAPTAETPALQVTWIEAPVPAVAPTRADTDARSSQADPGIEATLAGDPRRAHATADTRHDAPTAPPANAETPAAPSRPLSVVLLEQAAAQVGAGDAHDFRRNPLDTGRVMPAPPPERFRMREPVIPAKVLARIGQLLGGPDYEVDPCPRIRRNLANLGTAGADDAGLQEELRRDRSLCQ